LLESNVILCGAANALHVNNDAITSCLIMRSVVPDVALMATLHARLWLHLCHALA
jgi:hypothetical protein